MQHYLRYYQGGDILDFNGIENGVMLKKYSSRRGWTDGVHASHDAYTKKILDKLDADFADIAAEGLTNSQVAVRLHTIIKGWSNQLRIILETECATGRGLKVNELPTKSSNFQTLFN